MWLNVPSSPVVFDERYYVNAARLIAGLPAFDVYEGLAPGLDPNYEHPPLGKVLLALSVFFLGDSPIGWRAPSVLAGLAAIALTYAIVRSAGGAPWVAVAAAAVFSFDNLVFVLGRAATLDSLMVSFVLLGALFYWRGMPLLGGAACGLAALVKLTGIFGICALLMLELMRGLLMPRETTLASGARTCLILMVGFSGAWFGLLFVLDTRVALFRTPWDHLAAMLDYGFALSLRSAEAGAHSRPWEWLWNEGQMVYYQSDGVLIRGALHPFTVAVALPAVVFAGWRAVCDRDRLSLWILTWVFANYVTLIGLAAITERVMYIHYILPTIPAIAAAVTLLLAHSRVPLELRVAFGAAYAACFLITYPFLTGRG